MGRKAWMMGIYNTLGGGGVIFWYLKREGGIE